MNPPTRRLQPSGAPRARPARPPAAGRRNVSLRGAPPRRVGVDGGWIQRRRPQTTQSGVGKAIGGLQGTASRLTKRGTKPPQRSGAAKRGGQVGGLALLAAAAGIAVKNRDKLTSLLHRDHGGAAASDVQAAVPAPPAADVAGAPPADSRDAGTQP